MLADSTVECVADVHAQLGEGPVWVGREAALYWLDIKDRKIFRLDEGGALSEWVAPFRVGSLAPRARGGFIAGTDEGIAAIDLTSGRFEIVARPEAHLPDNRFNDGKVDRQGRFWAGSMDDPERADSGTLYRVEPDLEAVVVDQGYRVTNGPAFNRSGDVMYHNDSARRVTYRFKLGTDGRAGERETFLRFGEDEGYPDGMTVDSKDCLWIAFWDGWCLRRYSPGGDLLGTVEMPVQRPTSCAFGGRDLSRLYITSARVGLDESVLRMQPNAGGLFMVTPGVKGVEDMPFAG